MATTLWLSQKETSKVLKTSEVTLSNYYQKFPHKAAVDE